MGPPSLLSSLCLSPFPGSTWSLHKVLYSEEEVKGGKKKKLRDSTVGLKTVIGHYPEKWSSVKNYRAVSAWIFWMKSQAKKNRPITLNWSSKSLRMPKSQTAPIANNSQFEKQIYIADVEWGQAGEGKDSPVTAGNFLFWNLQLIIFKITVWTSWKIGKLNEHVFPLRETTERIFIHSF